MAATTERSLAEADECIRSGRLDTAILRLNEVLVSQPDHSLANMKLGELSLRRGDIALGERYLAVAVSADPNLLFAANNLAIIYWTSGRAQLAVNLLQDTVSRAPQFPEAWFNLGSSYLQLHRYDHAIKSFEKAISVRPNYSNAWVNLGRVYRLSLQHDRTIECLRKAAQLTDDPQALSNLVFAAMSSAEISAAQVAELAANWDVRFGIPFVTDRQTAAHPITPRCLNIGYVGPTFRRHAVGWLIEPVLAGHDRNQFRVFCYSDVSSPDEVTQRIGAMELTYRDTRRLSHEQLAEVIRQDRIDILVDLNAHTAGSRLRTFAYRPAPVQVNYLAYPFTCGASAMDYRVTDYLLDPVEGERYGPEALIRLRHSFWLYRPDADLSEPAREPPAMTAGCFTFANLNNTRKFNRSVAEVWAAILTQVPNSRLLMLVDNVAAQSSHFSDLFSSVGVDPARCLLIVNEPRASHLTRYTAADLCLDPFPYGGHTTALDSLWMGVPVLTLSGVGPYTRGAASILPRVGLDELVTCSRHEYIATAVRLAKDLDHLATLRSNLRERMRQSLLCDETGFVTEYETALTMAWERHCKGLPPSDIHPS